VSGALGIHASNIKVVSIYEGSLVVNYDIVIPDATPTENDTSDSNSTVDGNSTNNDTSNNQTTP